MPRGTPPKPNPAGNIRYTIILRIEAHRRLAELTAKFSISQSDVIEALVLNCDDEIWAPIFKKVHQAKAGERGQKKDVLKKLEGLPAEKLAELLKLAEQKA